MRTENEVFESIMKIAEKDERIRAVTLNGSRASKSAVIDQYSDFDIVYFVKDIREFTSNNDWVSVFGDILIVQHSMDWYSNPYDYSSKDKFIYLIQFADGHRIDLSLVDLSNFHKENLNKEPTKVLLNKDNLKDLHDISDESMYFINEPTIHEFLNTSNEFRWMSTYITKGLCRHELYYAKYAYDVLIMEMFMKMLNWKIGIENDFEVSTGSFNKYLKKYISGEDMKKLHSIFPNGEYDDIWEKLFVMYDFFHKIEKSVRTFYNFETDENEIIRVRCYLEKMNKYFVEESCS